MEVSTKSHRPARKQPGKWVTPLSPLVALQTEKEGGGAAPDKINLACIISDGGKLHSGKV